MILEISTEMEQEDFDLALEELDTLVSTLNTNYIVWENKRGKNTAELDENRYGSSLLAELLGRCSQFRVKVHEADETCIKMTVYHHDAPCGAYRHVYSAIRCDECSNITTRYYETPAGNYCQDCVTLKDNEE